MTPDELIQAIKDRPVTQADMDAFAERCRKREEEFKKWERKTRITTEWLNRQYG